VFERLRQRGAKQAVQEEIGSGEKQAYLPCSRVNRVFEVEEKEKEGILRIDSYS